MERRSTTTLGNQPPPSATPFSFSFRVVYRGMEDGKPATVRELTTFFRFSRGEGCAGGAVGLVGGRVEKNGKRKAEAGRARPPRARATPRRAREETPTKGLRQVMMYRGKFPAENYTQTWPADLSLKGNRLPFSLARYAKVRLMR